jgi:hypothetical protein
MTSRLEFTPDRPLPDIPELGAAGLEVEVPTRPDVLPDGRAALVVGEPGRWNDIPLHPGESAGSCAAGLIHALGGTPPDEMGTVSVRGLAALLEGAGVPAAVEDGHALEDLAQEVEAGWGVVAFVNSGELWGRPDALGNGDADRAVLVAAVARHPTQGELLGVYVRDPVGPAESAFIPADRWEAAWLGAGGVFVVAGARRE